jgi:hypothetical protein
MPDHTLLRLTWHQQQQQQQQQQQRKERTNLAIKAHSNSHAKP